MNVQQVNTVGGIFELTGVVLAVRELVDVLAYQGVMRRLRDRWQQARAAIMDGLRRLLRRPVAQQLSVSSVSTSARAQAANVSVAGQPATAQVVQSLEDRVDALEQRVDQLRKEIAAERLERQRAIDAERQRSQQALEREADELRSGIENVRGELDRLEELTTGDLGLRRDGILVLLGGIVLTTWPTWWSENVLGWLTWPLFIVVVEYFIAWRLVWAIHVALRRD